MTSETDSLPAAGATTASTAPTTTPTTGSRGKADWRLATKLVQGGILRTPFGETCEAIYMTSGYVYGSAEEAEAAFANKKPRFVYSRFANPDGADVRGAHGACSRAPRLRAPRRRGMAAVFASLACLLAPATASSPRDALFGSCQYMLAEILPRFGVETVLRRRPRSRAMAQGAVAQTQAVFLETPSNPDA